MAHYDVMTSDALVEVARRFARFRASVVSQEPRGLLDLPEQIGSAMGVDTMPAALTEAWRSAYLAAKLADDVMDQEPGVWPGRHLAYVLLLLSDVQERLAELPQACSGLAVGFAQALRQATLGQLAELNPGAAVGTEQWFEIAAAKSGRILQWVFHASACCAGANPSQQQALAALGYAYGLQMQAEDDFVDSAPANDVTPDDAQPSAQARRQQCRALTRQRLAEVPQLVRPQALAFLTRHSDV